MAMFLNLPTRTSFDIEKVVCSHGFFMMAPNVWNPSTKTLQRPFHLPATTDNHNSLTITLSISQHQHHNNSYLSLKVVQVLVGGTHQKNVSPSPKQQQLLLGQVRRMLRISKKDEKEIKEFHEMHQDAKERGFGRVFRSPTLFEDMVKSILLCNCKFERSLSMARALCELQFELRDGKHLPHYSSTNPKCLKRKGINAPKMQHWETSKNKECGDFPRAEELRGLTEEFLKDRCMLGYRAGTILRLAKKFEKLKCLTAFDKKQLIMLEDENKEEETDPIYLLYDNIYKELLSLKGFGTFASSYVLTCLGFYERIPADSETNRHLQVVHGRGTCKKKTLTRDANNIYNIYKPFQFLAYWFEIWDFYEKKFGKLNELDPSRYKFISGRLDIVN